MDKHSFLSNFINSMEQVRVKLGYSQSRMAQELGMSLSGYKKIISGETAKIDIYLGYQVQLLSGRYLSDLCGTEGVGTKIARRLPELTESQLNYVKAVVDFEADFAAAHEDAEDYVTVLIPTGNLEDGMIWDSADLEMVNVAAYRKRFGSDLHCALKITSDHMSPVYHQGDILLISKQPPRDGDVGLFVDRINGRGYIRKFYQTDPVRLEPINGYGQTIVLLPDAGNQWIKFGKVLAKMR